MSELDSVPTWLRMTLGTTLPDVCKLEVRAFEQVQKRSGLGRREFLQSMTAAAGGLAVDPDQLIWTPTKRKNIILPVASEQVVGVATVHGTRYYMLLDAHGTRRHLFFDSGWRLLHAVQRSARGHLVVVPMVTAEQAIKLVQRTGKTPIELGQMACQKHHGILDHTYDWRGNSRSFTVTDIAERLPPHPGCKPGQWPQEFRDLTPEETVRLVHDAAHQTVGDRLRRAAERLREQRRLGIDELPPVTWTTKRV